MPKTPAEEISPPSDFEGSGTSDASHHQEIVLSPGHVERVSYDESKVFVNVTRETIRTAPEFHMPLPAYHDTKSFN